MNLSNNLILGHVSSGAYHYVLGRIVPQFTAFLKPGVSGLPTWQVASNLQMGVQGILDNMLSEFGQDLIIRSAFQMTNGKYGLGQSFDLQVKGYENNMYGVAKTIQGLAKRSSDMQLVYGDTSFMRINYDEKSIKNNVITNFIPQISTSDLVNNVLEAGLTSIRGL